MTWTPSVVTAVRSYRQLTARLQHPGPQPLGGGKSPAPPGGQVHQVPVPAAALVVAAAVAAVVGGLHQRVGVQRGVPTQVLGHHPQQATGVPTQHPVRGGVQEAAAGERAAQLETQGGAAQIRKHKVAGTCDAYCFTPVRLYPDLTYDQRLPFLVKNKKIVKQPSMSAMFLTLLNDRSSSVRLT
jgi:hypothetical protein